MLGSHRVPGELPFVAHAVRDVYKNLALSSKTPHGVLDYPGNCLGEPDLLT